MRGYNNAYNGEKLYIFNSFYHSLDSWDTECKTTSEPRCSSIKCQLSKIFSEQFIGVGQVAQWLVEVGKTLEGMN